VLLTDLSPATKYYYSIGTGAITLQGTSSNYFFTAPAAGSRRPIRAWVLGDPGTDWPSQKSVRNAYYRFTGAKHTDLVLALGDNAYSGGTDGQYQKAFFDAYRDVFKHCVIWPALGNHDARSANSATQSGVYFDVFTLPTLGQAGGVLSGTEAYYSFNWGNAHFVCLNSHDGDLSTNGLMLTWLKEDLSANRQDWTIAFWHEPPYSKGSHDSDDEKDSDRRMTLVRERLVPIIERGGVDLVLCGHSHVYERSYLLRGHFGASNTLEAGMIKERGDGAPGSAGRPYRKPGPGPVPNSGTIYMNAGSAGHATRRTKLHELNHPAMCVSLNVAGSVILDIAGPSLGARFLDGTGTVRDHFQILKSLEAR
jgi:hypothetical protein